MQQVLDRDDDFRERVADGADEKDLGRASWLFLHRPDGWGAELSLLRAAANEEHQEESATRREHAAERRLAQLGTTLTRLRDELAAAERSTASSERALASERTARLELERSRDELTQRAANLETDRSRAVRNLKDAEARDVGRLDELRAARSQIGELEKLVAQAQDLVAGGEGPAGGEGSGHGEFQRSESGVGGPVESEIPERSAGITDRAASSPWDGTDPAAVASAVHQAAAAANALSLALDRAAQLLTPLPAEPESPVPADPDAAASSAAAKGSRPPRRSPIRLQRGVVEDSAQGVEQLLATPEVVVIVDGYNVSMEAWPLLDGGAQRSSLIAMLGAVQARTGASVHIVFDGDDDGRRPSVGAPLPVRVHFSHAEVEADDVVLDMVARLPTDRPVVVVSSDRRVRDGARRLGANIVRSSDLLSLGRN